MTESHRITINQNRQILAFGRQLNPIPRFRVRELFFVFIVDFQFFGFGFWNRERGRVGGVVDWFFLDRRRCKVGAGDGGGRGRRGRGSEDGEGGVEVAGVEEEGDEGGGGKGEEVGPFL